MRARWPAWAFLLLLGAHLVALYWPRIDATGAPGGSDKAMHLLLFGAPVLAGVLWLGRPVVIGLAFLAHAPTSEWMQASFLPGRSGDPLDAAWDCVGVVLGLLLAWLVLRRRQTARASSTRW